MNSVSLSESQDSEFSFETRKFSNCHNEKREKKIEICFPYYQERDPCYVYLLIWQR